VQSLDICAVGLGNPGPEYSMNRHNVGFRVVDRLASEFSVCLRKPFFSRFSIAMASSEGSGLFLSKPLTFMNRSGEVMPAILRRCGLPRENLLVICDSLDLPPGICRLKLRGGSGGHNGLKSIIQALGSEDFMRLYVGVGRPSSREEVVSFVLGNPGFPEAELIDKGLERAVSGIARLLSEPVERVMHELNRKEPS